ncbi:uncharacterized protein PV07_08693 [Cladophialophora immunda]|uniref:Uncharacterized protein n=1 Tax=Cladophialophora immunda TaxID=569365 RepID=A0A0D2AKP9_9EURO|nr:uncharacterized protein PV07_08693 [Cladophialophora immunda]KIW25527.1 hypothetical protein PV07_08693 [Cladophialophora immunda]
MALSQSRTWLWHYGEGHETNEASPRITEARAVLKAAWNKTKASPSRGMSDGVLDKAKGVPSHDTEQGDELLWQHHQLPKALPKPSPTQPSPKGHGQGHNARNGATEWRIERSRFEDRPSMRHRQAFAAETRAIAKRSPKGINRATEQASLFADTQERSKAHRTKQSRTRPPERTAPEMRFGREEAPEEHEKARSDSTRSQHRTAALIGRDRR